jgi:hypothetical protein
MQSQPSFFCLSVICCFNLGTLPLLETIVEPPLIATPNGIQLGYKQFLIIVTMESIGFT